MVGVDSDEILAARRLGTQIGMWQLERVLGSGGMATVFLGRRSDGQAGAVKLLHTDLIGISEVRKRFLREGPIGSALIAVGPLCRGLPQIWETGVAEDGTAYMVMELLEGETVAERLARSGPFPLEHALWVAQQVLDVLVLAHEHGIVHRDLKPENLHIGLDGHVKVLDFGIARVLQDLPDGAELPEKTRTKTGTAMGTCQYMPPEQARGNVAAIDGRTDIFSLAATLFHLLSGQLIHGRLIDASLLIASATARVKPLAAVAPSLPPAVCAVVDRGLVFESAQRYPDAATMRLDVQALRAGRAPPYVSAIAAGTVPPGAAWSPPSRSR
jgi:eukaryotic-like serine/threonine-protein kinase